MQTRYGTFGAFLHASVLTHLRAPVALTLMLPGLLACGQTDDPASEPQRVAFAQTGRDLLKPLDSPDTSEARWVVDENGQAIHFSNEGTAPLMSLDCRLGEGPAQMRIVRHVTARPGQSALFPVIGNGLRSRFLVDAALVGEKWRWEGVVPAADPALDVFTGPRDLKATLPGGGMLEIAGSRVPGEFVSWCRAGGEVMQAEAEEQAEEAQAPEISERVSDPVS